MVLEAIRDDKFYMVTHPRFKSSSACAEHPRRPHAALTP
jgi:hypothetical protein